MIAVIIPVYNDAPLLPRAIKSCLSQIEVSEVIIIDDGSTDNINEALSQFEDPRLIVVRHKDGGNHGRSASRNLGIRTATTAWISFCDADDYYLPARFAHLDLAPDCPADGYYDTIEAAFATAKLSRTYTDNITSISTPASPKDLGNYLISNREERISILGLIVRKQVLHDIGLFDETLMIGEDTDLIWRLSIAHLLLPGDHTDSHQQAVAVRWIDGRNTYLDQPLSDGARYTFYAKWKDLLAEYQLSAGAIQRIKESYRYYSVKHRYGHLPDWCQRILRRSPFV